MYVKFTDAILPTKRRCQITEELEIGDSKTFTRHERSQLGIARGARSGPDSKTRKKTCWHPELAQLFIRRGSYLATRFE